MRLFTVFFLLILSAAAASAATLTVTTNADTGAGSLRAAITTANTNSQADTIVFDPAFFNQARTITITTATTPFNFATDTNPTTVTNTTGFPVILNGNNISSVATVTAPAVVILNNLNITGGNSNGFAGAGIFVSGSLTILNSAVYGNTTVGATATGNGAGIQVNGTVGVAQATVVNTTVSGNTAATGAGVRVFSGALTVTSCTITNNTATVDGGGVVAAAGQSYTIRNTISAGNIDQAAPLNPDAIGAFTSLGFNLIGNVGAATGFTGTGDQVGTVGTPINPQLAALGFYGGQTQTQPPLPGSPAIDKGNSFGVTVDQRGSPRPVDIASIPNAAGGDGADIGSVEQLTVTASGVSVSGKVIAPNGSRMTRGDGVGRAVVTMTDQNGLSRSVRTAANGNFRFDEVEAGQTYIFNVYSKSYQFNSQVVTVNENLIDLIFSAQ